MMNKPFIYEFSVCCFTSAEALLEEMEYTPFDLLLLDVYMDGKTGIEGAKAIRSRGRSCPIIFLTTSKEHALDAFGVNAVQYLVKSLNDSAFCSALDQAFAQIETERRRHITLRIENELRRIQLKEIVYCEAQGNYQRLRLFDGTEREDDVD